MNPDQEIRRKLKTLVGPINQAGVWNLIERRANTKRRPLRRYLIPLTVAVVLMAGVSVGVLEAVTHLGRHAQILVIGDESTLSGSSAVKEAQILQRLKAAGLDVSAVRVQGTKLSVSLRADAPTAGNAIENTIRGMNLFRVASEAGMTWAFDWVLIVGGKRSSGGQIVVPLDVVAHVTSDVAAAAVAAWVDAIDAKTGAHTTYSFQDYRIDLNVTGSTTALEAAAQDYVTGGFGLHSKGQLRSS